MKLTIVGSAGTFPGPTSACSSYLLEHDGFRLLLDIGNGSLGALQEACGLLGTGRDRRLATCTATTTST